MLNIFINQAGYTRITWSGSIDTQPLITTSNGVFKIYPVKGHEVIPIKVDFYRSVGLDLCLANREI